MSVTIKDIAKQAGVSYSTVSKALNNSPLVKDATKNKILMIANDLGYEPNYAAQALVSKETKVIGLIWPTIERVAPSTLLTKINEEITANHYSMIVAIDTIEKSIEMFKRFQVDGVILFNMPNIELPNAFPLPVITYGAYRDIDYPIVDVNYEKAMELAVEYLYQLGHKKIAFIGDFSPIDERQIYKFNGFKKAMGKLNLQVTNANFINTGGLDWYDGYLATNRLLTSSFVPTAIIGASYDITSGIIRSLRHHHYLIPKDMSVISYDNIPQMENLEIPVSSVGVPVDEIAQSIVSTLISYIKNTTEVPTPTPLTPKIVERISCAAKNKQ